MPDPSEVVTQIQRSMGVTRIVARRTIKSPTENTTEEIEIAFDGDDVHPRGVNIAAHLVGLRVELLALRHALANGSIPQTYFHDQEASLKAQYAHLIDQEFTDAESP